MLRISRGRLNAIIEALFVASRELRDEEGLLVQGPSVTGVTGSLAEQLAKQAVAVLVGPDVVVEADDIQHVVRGFGMPPLRRPPPGWEP